MSVNIKSWEFDVKHGENRNPPEPETSLGRAADTSGTTYYWTADSPNFPMSPNPLASNDWSDVLSTRTRRCLREAGISSLTDLRAKKPEELLAIPSFGATCLEEVKRFLKLQDLPRDKSPKVEPLTPLTEPLSSHPFFRILSQRTRNCLAAAGISSLADLRETDRDSLLAIKNFGTRSLREVDEFLEANLLLPVPRRSFAPEVGPNPENEFSVLSTQTQDFLQQLGICSSLELRSKRISELLEVPELNVDALDEAFSRCGLPQIEDEQDLLLLLSVSESARVRLSNHRPQCDSVRDQLAHCRRKVERQIEDGTLHERALMDWTVVQGFNRNMSPPSCKLLDVLSYLEHLPVSAAKIGSAVEKLEKALDVSTINQEVEDLLHLLDSRGIEVLRGRFVLGKPQTLRELAQRAEVTGEAIRQTERRVITKLREAYYSKLPLPRIRTAILLTKEHNVASFGGVVDLMRRRGLATTEQVIKDFFSIWQAIAPGESGISDYLLAWRAIDLDDYAFPEDIVEFAATGFTRLQRELSSEVLSIAHRRLRIVGVIALEEVVSELQDEDLSVTDVAAVLTSASLNEIAPGYWGTTTKKYTIHRVAEKMIKVCGPLHVADIHIGLLRHQQRLNKPVPPLDALRAALDRHQAFHLDADGVVHLHDLGEGALPNAAEYVWLEIATSHGPVVHVSTIYRAIKGHGLNNGLVTYLIRYSEVVQPAGEALYCIPGTRFDEEDLEAGRTQASNAWAKRFAIPNSVDSGEQDTSEAQEKGRGQRRLLLPGDFGQTLNPPRSKEAIVGLCQRGRIEGVTKGPRGEWLIPEGAILKIRSIPKGSERREGIGPDQYAEMHGATRQRVHQLLGQNRIEGAKWTANGWEIPPDAPYPTNRYGTHARSK